MTFDDLSVPLVTNVDAAEVTKCATKREIARSTGFIAGAMAGVDRVVDSRRC